MRLLKLVISAFLLLTYLLGFAHNLIPHCQELISGEHQSARHHHHHHQYQLGEGSNPGQVHILHKDHFDADIFDLIICFLSEMEHHADDCNIENYIPVSANDRIKASVKLKQLAALFSCFRFTEQSDTFPASGGADVVKCLSPFLDVSRYRGPPSLSC